VLHAELVKDGLINRGIAAECVTGSTPDTERARILAGFDSGEFPALTNVGVLTEGWDCPRADCIVLLRPTKSSALFVQMVGRGLRLSPETGKTDCLILDFGGNIERLGPVDQADEREPKQNKRKVEQEAPYRRCGEWDAQAQGFVGGCGHKNAPAAIKCEVCGQLFVRHEDTAKRGGLISSERALKDFDVERVSYRIGTSQSTGNSYLRISYHCGLFETFYKNLMLGYGGYAGQKAVKEWAFLTEHGTTPDTPERAVWLLDMHQETIKQPVSITVDVASRWKDIHAFHFDRSLCHAA